MLLAVVVALSAPSPLAGDHSQGRDLEAGGAFTCDFGLSADISLADAPAGLERDRMFQSAQRGFVRKLVPFVVDPETAALFSGGRYLFDTQEDADAYREWITNDFALDGVRFFDRPFFLDPDCRAWAVIGARHFTDIHASHVVMRTERWAVPADNQRALLKRAWPTIRAEGAARGLSSVWLLYNQPDQVVSLVYVANRVVPWDPTTPDFATLSALSRATSLGAAFADQPWFKIFDRTHWVLSTWFPFVSGDHGEPSLWPNSPPFPQPHADDGVCEVSRGENWLNAPADCLATCGDGIVQAGEDTFNCPGDGPRRARTRN
jgi:hypothetical protein